MKYRVYYLDEGDDENWLLWTEEDSRANALAVGKWIFQYMQCPVKVVRVETEIAHFKPEGKE